MTASAAADGIRFLAVTVQEPSGSDTVSQRLAEHSIAAIPEIAKNAKLLVVPDTPADVIGAVATAMSIAKTISVNKTPTSKY